MNNLTKLAIFLLLGVPSVAFAAEFRTEKVVYNQQLTEEPKITTTADVVVYGLSKHNKGVLCNKKECNEFNPGSAVQLNFRDPKRNLVLTFKTGMYVDSFENRAGHILVGLRYDKPVYSEKVKLFAGVHLGQINGSGFERESSPLGVTAGKYAIGGYPYVGLSVGKVALEVLATNQVTAAYLRFQIN